MRALFTVTVIPVALILTHIYRKDRLEKEPRKFLLKLLLFGALSIIPAFIIETLGELAIEKLSGSLFYSLLDNFIVIALTEEACKYLFLKKLTWKSEDFDCSYDGLIYAVFVSMGFAAIEDLLYIMSYGLGTGFLRAVTALPGHSLFAVFMGIEYGKAKSADYRNEPAECKRHQLSAILYASLAHGIYDFLAGAEGLFFILFFVFLAILFILGIRQINRCSQDDHYITPSYMRSEPFQGTWRCPVCGRINDGLFCTFCRYDYPKDGDLSVPAKPVRPSVPAPLHPGSSETKKKRLLWILLIPAWIPIGIIGILLEVFALEESGSVLLMILGLLILLFAFVMIFLPLVKLLTIGRKAEKKDPQYSQEMSKYRAVLQENMKRSTAYDQANEKWINYQYSKKIAEKKMKNGEMPM